MWTMGICLEGAQMSDGSDGSNNDTYLPLPDIVQFFSVSKKVNDGHLPVRCTKV